MQFSLNSVVKENYCYVKNEVYHLSKQFPCLLHSYAKYECTHFEYKNS